jgi:hypothetical protein
MSPSPILPDAKDFKPTNGLGHINRGLWVRVTSRSVDYGADLNDNMSMQAGQTPDSRLSRHLPHNRPFFEQIESISKSADSIASIDCRTGSHSIASRNMVNCIVHFIPAIVHMPAERMGFDAS